MPTETKILSWSLHNTIGKNPADIDFEACFQLFLTYEQQLKLTVTKIGLAGKDYPINKVVNYAAGVKKLKENKFNNLTSITLYTSKPNSRDFAFDWDILFSISCSKILGTHVYTGIDSTYLTQNPDVVTDLITPLCQLIKPVLGYAYISLPDEGPFAYSTGSIHTPQNDYLTEDHKELILAWARNKDLIVSGKLRDLYPEMILSDVHLTYEIDDQPLKKWILSDSEHGTLTTLAENNYYWQIPDMSYLEIRNKLAKSDMLIAYDKFIIPTILP